MYLWSLRGFSLSPSTYLAVAATGLFLTVHAMLADAASIPPAQFLADISDGVQRKCGTPDPSPCIVPSAQGDTAFSAQVVTDSDSGTDVEDS